MHQLDQPQCAEVNRTLTVPTSGGVTCYTNPSSTEISSTVNPEETSHDSVTTKTTSQNSQSDTWDYHYSTVMTSLRNTEIVEENTMSWVYGTIAGAVVSTTLAVAMCLSMLQV